jgi:hypothetical protein
MDKFFENLKREAEANPIMALGVGAALLTAAAKLIEAAGSVPSKRAYAKKYGKPSR